MQNEYIIAYSILVSSSTIIFSCNSSALALTKATSYIAQCADRLWLLFCNVTQLIFERILESEVSHIAVSAFFLALFFPNAEI